jgi:hypothetical protein
LDKRVVCTIWEFVQKMKMWKKFWYNVDNIRKCTFYKDNCTNKLDDKQLVLHYRNEVIRSTINSDIQRQCAINKQPDTRRMKVTATQQELNLLLAKAKSEIVVSYSSGSNDTNLFYIFLNDTRLFWPSDLKNRILLVSLKSSRFESRYYV